MPKGSEPLPDFAVSVAIRGDDQLSDNLRRLTKSVDRFGKKADQSFGLASRAAGVFKGVVGGVLVSGAISAGFNAMRMGAASVVKEFIDMDQALVSAGAKFQLSKLGAEQAASTMQKLKDAAREVGAATEYTAAEGAQGLEFLAAAGFTAEQAIASLPVMVDLATASNSDFASSASVAADAIGAFGLASSDAQVQAKNLQRITDVFAQTAARSNVGMEDLFETFKMGAPIMTTAGQSLESFAAMTAIMGNAGIKGSLAGTTLKNTIDRLIAPVGKGAEVLEQLKIQAKDSGGNMRDVATILEDFGKATEGMGNAQRTAAISAVFGMHAVSGIATILDTGIPTLKEFRSGLEDAGGASKKMADEMRRSLGNRIKVLKSGLTELGLKVIEAFSNRFPNALESAIKAVQNFDVMPIVDGIKAMVETVKSVWNWFDKWKFVIFGVLGALATLRIALALTAAVEMFIAVVTGVTTVTKLWAASQWAANLALLANPVTLIIAGIIALIAIIVLAIVYWDEIVAAWQAGLNSMYAGTNETTNAIADFFGMMSSSLTNIAIDIDNAFGEVWYGMRAQVADTVSYVIGAWGALKAALGMDVSGLPSREDITKWFGIDETYKPTDHIDYSDASQGYRDAFATTAQLLGANTDNPPPPPNRANREASQNNVNLSGVIDVVSSSGLATETSGQSTVNGHKAPGVDWRSKGGKNSGA
jgi:TP901 family phage tail tape measure protein